MGSMMSLLFASHDTNVSMYDSSSTNVEEAYKNAKDAGFEKLITPYKDYSSLCSSVPSSPIKVYMLSTPHGTVGDSILDSLDPCVKAIS